MSTQPPQGAGGDGETLVWKRRDISAVRRELYVEFAIVQSAYSFASVSHERPVKMRANRFHALLNERVAEYNACAIDDISAEHTANDLLSSKKKSFNLYHKFIY